MCLQCPRGAGENGNGPLVSEALPRFFPIWDLHDPGGEDRLSPVSPGLGKGEKLACTESLVDARLCRVPSPHPKHTDTTGGRIQSHTRHTGDDTTETPTTVPGAVENFRATFVLPISFHSTPLPVAPTAEAMWAAERMWRLGVHSPFPFGLCDPRQSLHLSWGNQPSRQLFPPLGLSLSLLPPPSSGSAALSAPAGCP